MESTAADTTAPKRQALFLESLVETQLDLVYSAALRQVRNPQLAEDITQTVFLIAAKKAHAIPPDRAAAWLFKVTRFVALTTLRAQRRRSRHERGAATMTPHLIQSSSTEDSVGSNLDEALSALGQFDRQLIILRYFQSQSVADAATALQITTNTASKRIERALEKMRRHFHRRGITLSQTTLGDMLPSIGIASAPKALAPRIITASTTLTAPAIAFSLTLRIIFMTLSTPLKIAATAAILLMLSAGAYSIIDISPGPATSSAPPAADAPQPSSDRPGTTTLSGIVLHTAGQPIPNVLISQGYTPYINTYRTTHTTPDGKFTLPGIPLGEDLALAAQAPNFSPDLIRGVVTPHPGSFLFSL